ncbi:MAG TPA: hypothetical protein VEQ36_12150 [Thermomicrobiales bacterium]|nr:hypothetical protein [Thermomicrobiales bacterium]
MLAAMRTLNPQVPEQYLQQALAEITTPRSNDAITENYRLHKAIVEGFRGITFIDPDGVEQTPTIRLVSHDPAVNDWLAVHQVTVHRERSTAASTSSCTATGCRCPSSNSKGPAAGTPTRPPLMPSCGTTSASSRWRSGSAC